MRSFLLSATVAALAVVPSLAIANDRYVPRPPVMLSPDLSEPWLLQYKARNKVGLSDPTLRAPVQRVQPQKVSGLFTRITPQKPAAAKPSRQFDPAFLPTVVNYTGSEKPGTIVIDTEARYLYLVQADGSARRYGVGVGKPGFEWAGEHTITRKAEWPGWTPPAEMIARRPDLPRHMEGGPGNPLGARAMYLGSTLYRIHGSNEPWSIGRAVSSGCIRMRNEDVTDLYGRVGIGTKVIVM